MRTVNPAQLFSTLHKVGESELIKLREVILQQRGQKPRPLRTWGINQAAELIGRSAPWLRENDPDAPKDARGHGRWTLKRINDLRAKIGASLGRPAGTEPITLALSNFKGGVGKTTSAAHLAHKAAISGLRVLAVDLDPQASLTHILGAIIPEIDLEERDLLNRILLEDPSAIRNVIRPTYFHNVDLIPASSPLQELDLTLVSPEANNADRLGSGAHRLKTALSHLDEYDLIIIDCAPNMGALTTNALMAANALITPLRPAAFDRASHVMFCGSLSLLFQYTGQTSMKYVRVLITQHGGGADDVYNETRIRTLYGNYVLSSVVQVSGEIAKAYSQISTVYDLERPISGRTSYMRAMDFLDRINNEILQDLRAIWEAEK